MTTANQYLPIVSWKTVVKDVVMLTSTTYRVTVSPIDLNEPGATLPVLVGFYLKDFLGYTYRVSAINVGGIITNIELTDDFLLGWGPQQGRIGIVYESVDLGTSPYLSPAKHKILDLTAIDYSRAFELDILWRNRYQYWTITPNALAPININSQNQIQFLDTASVTWSILQSSPTLITVQATASSAVGPGTAGYLPKWATVTTLGDSPLYTDGTKIGLGLTTMIYDVDILGSSINPFRIRGSNNAGLIIGTGMYSGPAGVAIYSATNDVGAALTASATNYSIAIWPGGMMEFNIPSYTEGLMSFEIGGTRHASMTKGGGWAFGDTYSIGVTNTALTTGMVVIKNNLGINLGVTGTSPYPPVLPAARLHLGAGTAAAGTASFKINPGTLLSTTESGAIETTSTHIYWTSAAGTRYQLDQQGSSGITLTTTGTSGAATLISGVLNIPNYATGSGIALTNLSVTNTGTSGNATYNNSTGVFNIPNYTFTLPAASASVLGGVMVGSGLSITAGVLSATGTTLSLTTTGSGAATLTGGVLNIPTPSSGLITSLTTTGTSGAATLIGGVLNIPNYATGGSSISLTTAGSGAATLISGVLNIPTPSLPGSGITVSTGSGWGTSFAATSGSALNSIRVNSAGSAFEWYALSLTTTGSGSATLTSGTNSLTLNIPTPPTGECIAFEFNDVTGSTQTYVLDLDADENYLVTGIIMQSITDSVVFTVKNGSTTMITGTATTTKSGSFSITSGSVSASNIITLVLNGSSATGIRGKIRLTRT